MKKMSLRMLDAYLKIHGLTEASPDIVRGYVLCLFEQDKLSRGVFTKFSERLRLRERIEPRR